MMKGLVVGGVVLFIALLNILTFGEPDGTKYPGGVFTTIIDACIIQMLIMVGFEALMLKFSENNR